MRRRNRQPRVYAFIDSQNLNMTVKKLGWKMDWKKLRQFLHDKFGVTQAFMFIGYIPEQEKMYEQLHEAGYMVVLKPTFDMTRPRPEMSDKSSEKGEEEEKKPVKGNIDADLVLWAMKEMKDYDKAVIVSGDGDFYALVEYLVEHGKLQTLLTPSGHYSGLFNRFDEHIVRLDQHRRELVYHDRRKRPPRQKSPSHPK